MLKSYNIGLPALIAIIAVEALYPTGVNRAFCAVVTSRQESPLDWILCSLYNRNQVPRTESTRSEQNDLPPKFTSLDKAETAYIISKAESRSGSRPKSTRY